MGNLLINRSDIVRFREWPPTKSNPCAGHFAGAFCYEHDLTGSVVGEQYGLLIVDFGLGYTVYTKPEVLEVVARAESIPIPESEY